MDHTSIPNNKKKKKKLVNVKNQLKNMSKEARQAAIIKKKKCNDRAIEIVNLLIEPNVTEEILLNCLFDINQTHLDDVVEERALQKICGYPLCGNPLTCVPQKQFHISTRTNKVYDITERKNFCSNTCYKAGKYLKDQLYTSPLWLREHENLVAFKLLPLGESCGIKGEEIDLGNSRVKLDNTGQEFPIDDSLSVGDDESNQVGEASEQIFNPDITKGKMECDEDDQFVECSVDLSSKLEAMDLCEVTEEKIEPVNSNIKVIRESVSSPVSNLSNSSKEDKKPKMRHARAPKQNISPKDVIIKIENIMRSWFSFETYCFLLGEEKVRQELDGFGLKLQSQNSNDPYLYDQFVDLCKRLNLLELEETYGAKDVSSPKKPLPDYDKLKEESQKLEIKVNSFFKGNLEYEVAEERVVSSDEPLPVLPPLDHHAAKATRRRIFLQKLCYSMPDIQNALGLSSSNVSEQMKEFAMTLNLTSHNISLKPSEWNIVAIVLIKLLSLRDHNLREGLLSKKAAHYLELILMSYTLDSGYLDRLVCWLLDINHLVNSNKV